MADETLTQLYTGATWPNGYSTSNLLLLLDVTDASMASTGTDKGITVANFVARYPFVASGGSHAAGFVPDPGASAGSTHFLCENATWSVPAGGAVSSVFTRTGAVVATSGDYAYNQVTGAAPLDSPTFTGSVTLPAGTVTLAEQANLAIHSLMGNPTASPAAPSAITLGANLSFSGTTLVSSNTGGTVTSVSWTGDGVIFTASADTPVTTSGTLTPVSMVSQVKNTFLGGPTTGANAAPTFRALVGSDLPNPAASTLGGIESIAAVSHNFLTAISTTGVPAQAQPAFTDISGVATTGQIPSLPASQITSGTLAVAQGGTNLATLTAHAVMLGEGTSNPGFATIGTAGRLLIDQGAAADPSFNAASGDVTVAASGAHTIAAGAVTLAKQANFAASSLMGNPTGSPAAPSAITLVGGLGFSGTTATINASNIATGQLPVAQGGTNLATLTAHAVMLGEGTSNPAFATIGTAGRVLTDNGAGADPSFAVIPNATYVTSVLGGSYSVTTSWANVAFSGTNIQVTLPVTGTYLIMGQVRVSASISGGSAGLYAYIATRLYDSTNSVAITNSQMLPIIIYNATTSVTYSAQQTSGLAPVPYTITGSAIVVLQGIYATNGTASGISILNDGNGCTTLTAIRVS